MDLQISKARGGGGPVGAGRAGGAGGARGAGAAGARPGIRRERRNGTRLRSMSKSINERRTRRRLIGWNQGL